MLELRNVTKKYLNHAALSDVSFTLPDGAVCLLLGPNGSGKTTMMKTITGLAKPTGGQILLDGVPVGVTTKAHVAYMPTENYFYNYMTVNDAGRYYADFFPDFHKKRFDALLKDLELLPKDRIRQLSSGMAAKLRLALALSRDAELLMFDEPLNGVDILTRTQVINAILAGRREGRSMLISTHLVDELEDVVDHVALLKQGVLMAYGPKEQVCAGRTLKDLYLDVFGHGELTALQEGAYND